MLRCYPTIPLQKLRLTLKTSVRRVSLVSPALRQESQSCVPCTPSTTEISSGFIGTGKTQEGAPKRNSKDMHGVQYNIFTQLRILAGTTLLSQVEFCDSTINTRPDMYVQDYYFQYNDSHLKTRVKSTPETSGISNIL
jgi:hypothetical protein